MAYCLTIVLSAFLLFAVQPMISRFILPWFGGGPSVWTTCMLFFQTGLLAGYAYAHGIASRLKPRAQVLLHLILVAGAIMILPVLPDPALRPADAGQPIGRILWILFTSIAGPYLVLAATGPLLQRWYSLSHPGKTPYRLFALSNAGSLAALVSYPFLVEPWLGLETQAWAWSGLFIAYAATCLVAGLHLCRHAGSSRATQSDRAAAPPLPPRGTLLLWFLLPACASVLLLATTSRMCQEVAVVPFLWVLPLVLYLLTFILCFESDGWYRRKGYAWAYRLAGIGVCYLLFAGIAVPIWLQVLGYSAALFIFCMICHGELSRLRPDPTHLTLYYLFIATGGAAGGLFTALAAPALFSAYHEFAFGVIACGLFLLVTGSQHAAPSMHKRLPLALYVGVLALVFAGHAILSEHRVVARSRNFYGMLRIIEHEEPGTGRFRQMMHGRIQHGLQLMDDDKRRWPTAYFMPDSGIGLALRLHPKRTATPPRPLRVGVVGLGVGTVAAYGRQDDVFDFYEINPDVERLARAYFTYLADTPAAVSVHLGDGRLALERRLAQSGAAPYDILMVDAFSSDAIPMHLLTREGFAVYMRSLAPGGLLAINVTNRYVDLRLMVRRLAREAGSDARLFVVEDRLEVAGFHSRWILVSSDTTFFRRSAIARHIDPWPSAPAPPVWTDDYGSLLPVLRW